MQTKERDIIKAHDGDIVETLNMYWDGVCQDPIYHFEKLAKFSSIWMFHNNNRLAGERFDWKAWIEHQGYSEKKSEKKVAAK